MRVTILFLLLLGYMEKCYTQNVKLGIRGGTFSPYSLYNALIYKNPRPELNRFTTSNPHSLGICVSVEEKTGLVYGVNATARRIDIQQTASTNFETSYSTWENYDFDLNLGYRLFKTDKSSIKILGGFGVQKRLEYTSNGFLPLLRYLPDSSVVSSRISNKISPISSLPVFINLKIELDYKISKRFDLFFCFESNVFLNKNYFLQHTWETVINGFLVTEHFNGARFSNNSISSTVGFKYNLFKNKNIQ